jgi:hypothetical protein
LIVGFGVDSKNTFIRILRKSSKKGNSFVI